jgi:hypothetical protein
MNCKQKRLFYPEVSGIREDRVAITAHGKTSGFSFFVEGPPMNEPTILKNQNKEISMTTVEIAECIGKRHDHVKRDVYKMLVELYGEEGALNFQEAYKTNRNQGYVCYRLPKKELCLYLNSMRNTKNANEINKLFYGFGLDINEISIPTERREFKFGEEIVNNLFSGYEIIPQFQVQDYFVDWYIPELKLAVEFNEKHHKYKKREDAKRQKTIEKLLGCRFVIYTDY